VPTQVVPANDTVVDRRFLFIQNTGLNSMNFAIGTNNKATSSDIYLPPGASMVFMSNGNPVPSGDISVISPQNTTWAFCDYWTSEDVAAIQASAHGLWPSEIADSRQNEEKKWKTTATLLLRIRRDRFSRQVAFFLRNELGTFSHWLYSRRFFCLTPHLPRA
jgi:hypothetical protein